MSTHPELYQEALEQEEIEAMTDKKTYPSAAQPWLNSIPVMQQSVLFSGIRGMDGLAKRHPAKLLVRFYRRCVLISAFDGMTLSMPYHVGGGDFTGPSLEVTKGDDGDFSLKDERGNRVELKDWPVAMAPHVDAFIRARDEMPLHYFTHMMHAFQILGANHPAPRIAGFWHGIYERMCHALHLWPETPEQLNRRLGDTEAGWREREDCAGSCST